jgi:hypothetical protein
MKIDKKKVAKLYLRFRAAESPAAHAYAMARRIVEFEALGESKVRLRAEPEEENYFDAFGKPDNAADEKAIRDSIRRFGNWCLVAEYFNRREKCWEICDSIGHCAGYENPLDPFQNYYVPDLMGNAVENYKNQ